MNFHIPIKAAKISPFFGEFWGTNEFSDHRLLKSLSVGKNHWPRWVPTEAQQLRQAQPLLRWAAVGAPGAGLPCCPEWGHA